jgi:hypothetical protein
MITRAIAFAPRWLARSSVDTWRACGLVLLALCVTTCGGQNPVAPPSPTPAPTPTPAPPTLADLSASVFSADAGRQLNCREDVHARVTLVNHAESSVLATGVRKSSRIVSGGCGAPADFTYEITPRRVGANGMNVVLMQALYTDGSGCCQDSNACGGTCEVEETFEVLTDIGSVPAGHFQYRVVFSNCVKCGAEASSSSRFCAPISR